MEIRVLLKPLMLLAVLSRECSAAPQQLKERPRVVQGEASSIYNFPFVCSYHFTPRGGARLVLGTCTIFSNNKVFIAIDTVDRLINSTQNFWYQQIPQITVIAGSDVLDPPDLRSQPNAQVRKVRQFFVGTEEDPSLSYNPENLNSDLFHRNALGELACDIGMFLLDYHFEWNPFVLPIPLATLNFDTMTSMSREWIDRLETWPFLYDTCTVAGWGPIGNNELMHHQLSYVSTEECMETLCAHHASTCLEYPVKYHHVCFKSRQYGDVCVYDQGSPVFCPWFGKSVFAVLTRSFDCGLENMPAVYAVVSYVTNLFRLATRWAIIDARPDYRDPKYRMTGERKP